MKPVCFMVMPFRRKPVTNGKDDAPKELDYGRLWDAAFRPALEDLGFLPVRADLEPGSVIVKDMLNRLKHADLVLADMSLPNGNVYYEVGIRHVARESRCVLVAADWFKPLFDIDYIRTILYPLESGEVPDEEAAAIQEQYFLALSELGEHEKAIAGIQQLIRRFGATPERCGIIGGRFKRLYRQAREDREKAGQERQSVDERKHLQEAIKYYEQGMVLDLKWNEPGSTECGQVD